MDFNFSWPALIWAFIKASFVLTEINQFRLIVITLDNFLNSFLPCIETSYVVKNRRRRKNNNQTYSSRLVSRLFLRLIPSFSRFFVARLRRWKRKLDSKLKDINLKFYSPFHSIPSFYSHCTYTVYERLT